MLIERATTDVASNREVLVSHASFDGCFRGLSVLDSSYVSIVGCSASSCHQDGIYVGFGSPLVVITGGRIVDAGVSSLHPEGGNGLTVHSGSFTIDGVAVRNNRGRGIWVA